MASWHSPPAPLPLRQDKNKICSLQKSGLAKARQKEKHTSYNSVYAARAWLTPNARPYCPLRSQHRIHANVIRNSKNIFLLIRNFDRLFKKGNKFVFLFIRKGYKVFSPLRYENDLFIRGKRIQYKY